MESVLSKLVFRNGKGYLTSFSNLKESEHLKDYPFPGNSNIVLPNSGDTDKGWHLMGNPFPANYRWELSITLWFPILQKSGTTKVLHLLICILVALYPH